MSVAKRGPRDRSLSGTSREFYVILEGDVEVRQSEGHSRDLGRGEFFRKRRP